MFQEHELFLPVHFFSFFARYTHILQELSGNHQDAVRVLRMAVEDSDERGPWMKVQAGGVRRASIGAYCSSTRLSENVCAMRDDR